MTLQLSCAATVPSSFAIWVSTKYGILYHDFLALAFALTFMAIPDRQSREVDDNKAQHKAATAFHFPFSSTSSYMPPYQ